MHRSRRGLLIPVLGMVMSCVTYQDELSRGQRHFEASEYERSLAVLRVLEADIDSFGPADRARYAYLRGMTDHRMGYRADARHWLAIARELEQRSPGGLSEPWRTRLQEALKDLDQEVWDRVGDLPSTGDGGVVAVTSPG